jgi:hypothetical protein
MKKIHLAIFILLFACVIPQSFAKDYLTSIGITLNDGSPITDEQSIRLSLWSDGRYRDGDVSTGDINLSATFYSDYQTVVTRTPDTEGRLSISFGDLSNFPELEPNNQFMMIEYKDSGDPDTAYTVYTDTYVNGTALDRFPLIENGPDTFHGIYANDAVTSDSFTLDFDNNATDVILQFGETLAETLSWIDAQDYFFLSDSLVVDGNLNLQGTTLRLDSDEAGDPDQDVDIIAPQGSENDGTIRYDDGENAWQLSNDGGTFFDILTTGSVIPLVQTRRTTTLAIGTSFADVTFDTTDIETANLKLDHDSGTTDRILIEEDGMYLISFYLDVEINSGLLQSAETVDVQIRLNDSTVINGSTSSAGIPGGSGAYIFPISRTALIDLNDGDFLSVQMQRTGGTSATLQTNALFTAQRVGGL